MFGCFLQYGQECGRKCVIGSLALLLLDFLLLGTKESNTCLFARNFWEPLSYCVSFALRFYLVSNAYFFSYNVEKGLPFFPLTSYSVVASSYGQLDTIDIGINNWS